MAQSSNFSHSLCGLALLLSLSACTKKESAPDRPTFTQGVPLTDSAARDSNYTKPKHDSSKATTISKDKYGAAAGFAIEHKASRPFKITFPRGGDRVLIQDSLRGAKDKAYFVFDARGGQHVTLTIKGDGATAATITFPNGTQTGGPGGVIFDGVLPASGSSSIRVFEHMMGNEWKGRMTLSLIIK